MNTKPIPHCAHCGGTEILRDAYARWDDENQEWMLDSTFDYFYCSDCEGETSIEWRTPA